MQSITPKTQYWVRTFHKLQLKYTACVFIHVYLHQDSLCVKLSWPGLRFIFLARFGKGSVFWVSHSLFYFAESCFLLIIKISISVNYGMASWGQTRLIVTSPEEETYRVLRAMCF